MDTDEARRVLLALADIMEAADREPGDMEAGLLIGDEAMDLFHVTSLWDVAIRLRRIAGGGE